MGAARQTLATTSACGYELRCAPARASGRVLVVEPHPLTAEGLQLALSARGWTVETSSGQTAADAVAHAQHFQPHCVLVDIGIDLIGPLASTGAQVVVLTAERRRTVLAECLEAGAVGWIGRCADLDEVDATLSVLLNGGAVVGQTDRVALLHALRLERMRERQSQATFEQLTRREGLVLAALIDGLSAEEIAADHVVSLATVRSQIRAVLQKLGVRSQLAAVAVAAAHRDLLPQRDHEERERRRVPPRDRGRGPDRSLSIA